MKIIRIDEEIRTTMYRKPTNANHNINEKCKTPKCYKWAARRAYVNRAILICSNKELFIEEIWTIKTIAKTTGFKTYIVDKLYRKRIKKLSIITPAQNARRHFTRAIPYDKGKANVLNPLMPVGTKICHLSNTKILNMKTSISIKKFSYILISNFEKSNKLKITIWENWCHWHLFIKNV